MIDAQLLNDCRLHLENSFFYGRNISVKNEIVRSEKCLPGKLGVTRRKIETTCTPTGFSFVTPKYYYPSSIIYIFSIFSPSIFSPISLESNSVYKSFPKEGGLSSFFDRFFQREKPSVGLKRPVLLFRRIITVKGEKALGILKIFVLWDFQPYFRFVFFSQVCLMVYNIQEVASLFFGMTCLIDTGRLYNKSPRHTSQLIQTTLYLLGGINFEG